MDDFCVVGPGNSISIPVEPHPDRKSFEVEQIEEADLEQRLNQRKADGWMLSHLFSTEHCSTIDGSNMVLVDAKGYRQIRFTAVWYYPKGCFGVPIGMGLL